jgi:hypothetical protein
MRVNRFLTAALFGAGIWGCASAGTAGSGGGKNSNVITESEIAASSQRTVYDVVQHLRPTWITRGKNYIVNTYRVSSDTTGAVLVYVDNIKEGEIDALQNIQLSLADVASIQWLDPQTATATLPGAGGNIITGAIVIRRKK